MGLEITNQFVNTNKFDQNVENVVEVQGAKNTIKFDQDVENAAVENSFANTTSSNHIVEIVEQEENGVNITNWLTIANNVLVQAFAFMTKKETNVESVVAKVFVNITK